AGLAAIAGDGSAVLAVEGLSATQGSQVYETWFIGSTGTPVAVGGFAVDRDGVARFTTRPGPVEPGVTVALTLEPAPGATEPGGPVVVSGVATAPSS
ncbi:MAG TPA: anti-sigma factor, partial [Vitreimonas sp.]|nr:anti-sigma factor [Vitreimonas sp.]